MEKLRLLVSYYLCKLQMNKKSMNVHNQGDRKSLLLKEQLLQKQYVYKSKLQKCPTRQAKTKSSIHLIVTDVKVPSSSEMEILSLRKVNWTVEH